MRLALPVSATAVACFSATAFGQSVNYDLGAASSAPSASYGAGSGQSGIWNSAAPVILDIAGSPTAMRLGFNGGLGGSAAVAGAGADDHALMDDYSLFSPGDSWSLKDVLPGKYRLYLYLWAGSYEQSAGTNGFIVGWGGDKHGQAQIAVNYSATWPGAHVLGNTYAFADIELVNAPLISFGPLGSINHPSLVQGFQLVTIPSPGAGFALVVAGVISVQRRRRTP